MASSSGLWGLGLFHRQCIGCCRKCCGECGTRTDLRIGYRHLRLNDRIVIGETLTSPLFPAGTELAVEDRFSTRNSFHGLEIGLARTDTKANWELEYFGGVALGWNDSRVRVRGETTISANGSPPTISEGGLLALQSNSGRSDDADFATILQVGANVGYRVTDDLRLRVGYTFLFWPDVFRAGDQIDTTVNPNLLPPPLLPLTGPLRPSSRRHDSDFWRKG